MPPRYKRSKPASSVATRQRPIARSSTTSPPPIPPPTALVPRDFYRLMGSREESSADEEAEDVGDTNMEEGNPTPFPAFGTSFAAGTFGTGPSFQGASNMSNDEVLAHMLSRMDMFDTRLNGMESMIADRFQSIEIMHGSLDSRIDTMQGQ
ncbi:hypothetical protein JCGZ_22064 [Jatropha curcas]|uniref:Uncharacterized protein n=1 Tax=Jatropha curcas TaxID=180498 RepID=A0A067JSY4_JATCU|nr:hypothetical protein JCGZ_22064 [Jatropha curcas]